MPSRKYDVLPPKMFIPAKEGKRAGKTPEPFGEALDKYYAMRGWDKDGIPTAQTLQDLGLGAFA